MSMELFEEGLRKLVEIGAPILLVGESGTGKEYLAKRLALHRANYINITNKTELDDGDFKAINIGNFPETLLDNELFGHEKGAYTGAGKNRFGLFRSAGHGTAFLDEIGDMDIYSQGKLLRVLETKSVIPLGSDSSCPIYCSIIAATNKFDILKDEKVFRPDLLQRFHSIVELPNLRELGDEIADVIKSILMDINNDKSLPFYNRIKGVTPVWAGSLLWEIQNASRIIGINHDEYGYKGNARELRRKIINDIGFYNYEVDKIVVGFPLETSGYLSTTDKYVEHIKLQSFMRRWKWTYADYQDSCQTNDVFHEKIDQIIKKVRHIMSTSCFGLQKTNLENEFKNCIAIFSEQVDEFRENATLQNEAFAVIFNDKCINELCATISTLLGRYENFSADLETEIIMSIYKQYSITKVISLKELSQKTVALWKKEHPWVFLIPVGLDNYIIMIHLLVVSIITDNTPIGELFEELMRMYLNEYLWQFADPITFKTSSADVSNLNNERGKKLFVPRPLKEHMAVYVNNILYENKKDLRKTENALRISRHTLNKYRKLYDSISSTTENKKEAPNLKAVAPKNIVRNKLAPPGLTQS